MTVRDAIMTAAIGAALIILAVGIGYCAGRRDLSGRGVVTVTDTVWNEIHDTTFIEVSRDIVRHDTVRLAAVDTAVIRDSVFVEIPIEQRVFEGENYRITAFGYDVGLKDVSISYPAVTATKIVTRRWAFGVGVQAGYGITTHGLSPYAGLGISFGYVF